MLHLISFISRPIKYIRDWWWYRQNFDRDGYPRANTKLTAPPWYPDP